LADRRDGVLFIRKERQELVVSPPPGSIAIVFMKRDLSDDAWRNAQRFTASQSVPVGRDYRTFVLCHCARWREAFSRGYGPALARNGHALER